MPWLLLTIASLQASGSHDGIAFRPAPEKSGTDKCCLDTRNLGPFSDAPGYAIDRDHSVGSLVSLLLNPCRPAYISGLVTSIVVDPVDRVFRAWPLSDILKERLERVSPPLTDSDSPATVIWILRAVRVCASLDDGTPHLKNGRRTPVFCVAVGLASYASSFTLKAPAGLSVKFFQVVPIDDGFATAFTPATPARVLVFVILGSCDDGQPTENLSGSINEVRHNGLQLVRCARQPGRYQRSGCCFFTHLWRISK